MTQAYQRAVEGGSGNGVAKAHDPTDGRTAEELERPREEPGLAVARDLIKQHQPKFNIKLRELWNGLTAKHESGTLVRVSMPLESGAAEAAYLEQQAFIEQLVSIWPQATRRLIWPAAQG
jgi:hypothetical protein